MGKREGWRQNPNCFVLQSSKFPDGCKDVMKTKSIYQAIKLEVIEAFNRYAID